MLKGMENANNGIKDIVNVIGKGQVKKDVTDVANQKLDATNGLIDQAEKDYNETFVADYKKQLAQSIKLKLMQMRYMIMQKQITIK